MKKLFLVYIFFIFLTSYAQSVTKLTSNYYVDLSKLQEGSPIIEIKNSDLNGLSFEKNNQKAGNYYLENENQKFWFTINRNGQLTGPATAEFKSFDDMDLSYWSLLFENGKVKEIDVKIDTLGKPVGKIKVDDSTVVIEGYNKQNFKLKSRTILKNEDGFKKSIQYEYYDNGKMKFEFNQLDGISKRYYENGKIESYFNKVTTEKINYDENGIKIQHYYHLPEGGWCDEYFKDDIIIKKDCKNSNYSQQTQYYYKNGKLDFYEVTDVSTQQITKFDKNNRLINAEKMN